MQKEKIEEQLKGFASANRMTGKGALCVALVVTRHARDKGLPLEADQLVTKSHGQVIGMGKSSVQKILSEHGIDRVLAEEGGRTSRGSVRNMQNYVEFLNSLNDLGNVDFSTIEKWWVERVKEHFAGKPFILHLDSSKSLRAVIRDLFDQAEKRQSRVVGSTVFGTVLQHLVGAKLSLLVSDVSHHGASVADAPQKRKGDFLIEDVCIHVTTAPSESLIEKCTHNLGSGFRPVIITTQTKVSMAQELAEQMGIGHRVDVFDAEQFLAGNLYEIGKFAIDGRRNTADKLIKAYNGIVDDCETDPSLLISLSQ